jgi:hypothetical protein
MQTAVEIPDGLAVLPPGPGLAAALGTIELTQVPNDQILEVLRAQYRQLCHEQARTAAVLAEVGRCAGFPQPGEVHRLPVPERFAAEESRAALCWTRRAAQDEHDLAEAVVSQWPAVFAAWLAGDIDRPRVRIFDHYLTGLNETQVANICRVAVPKAHGLTTGQLAALLRRMVIAVDPDAAARWYREGIRRRGVVAYPAADGTITLSAHGLPADEAEAACTRLQELAAKAKRAGHPGLIDQIRADLCLGLLDGRFHHLTADQLVTALIDNHRAEWSDESDNADGTDEARCADQPAATTECAVDEPDNAPEAQTPGDTRPNSEATASSPATPDDPATEPAASGRPASPESAAGLPHDQRVGIEIRIGLATLLGRDEHPAEIPGLGLLPAPDARRRVHLQTRAEWRFALTDTQGRLVFDGITRRRPHGTRRDGPPGGIVELQVPLTLLTELLADDMPAQREWTDLITDIAAQHAGGANQYRDLDAHPDARLPGAALRRHTEIRDRTCTFRGCRRRAHSTEQDHTHDYHLGGPTVRINIGPLCPHDHKVKHLGGWRVEQPEPGTFTWHSPLGGVYRTNGEPFLPLMPDPAPADPGPRAGPGHDEIHIDEVHLDEPIGPILRRPPAACPPRRPPPRDSPDDPPPF